MVKRRADMAYAFLTLLFLLIPMLSHAYQRCPEQVNYNCPDYKGTSMMFPFTNTSLPDCGYCNLECKNHTSTFQCGHQQLSYKTKQIYPNNRTVVLVYPGLRDLITNACNLHQNDSIAVPNPPLTSYQVLNLMVFYRCQVGQGIPPTVVGPSTTCGHDIVYGPYAADKPPKLIPPVCSQIRLPNSTDDNFSIVYQLPDECSQCSLDRSRCLDQSSGKLKCRRKGNKNLAIILGSVTPGCLLIILALLILYCRQKKIKAGLSTVGRGIISFNQTRTDLEEGSINGVTVFSYNELEEATNNFDPTKELGEGGFGIVYHGKLKDGREVAVKRLYEKSYKRIEQFKNEIKILTDLRHKNLVSLYGCTSHHSRELLLVYEYIPNGTVAEHLHGNHPKSQFISWSTRMNIAIETAEALSYLHYKDIIHRDIKTNNILLDDNFCVKLADFGLSRLFPVDVTHVSTAPQGTPGYLDPEYHQCYHLTDKSDVYSFGVVLVELLSSLPAVDIGRERHEINLSNYAISRIQCCAFNELVDPKLGYETDSKVRKMTTLVAELAFQCLQHEKEVRPSMDKVLDALKRILSLDYDALEADIKQQPSSAGNADIGFVKNAREPQSSPEPVREKWLSQSMKLLNSLKDNDGLKLLRPSQGRQPKTYSQIKNDVVGLLKNAQPMPTSPDSVMDKWSSKSSTPNISS